MGTLHYMAPEQFEHASGIDHRVDIYSVGVMFYEMLTGQLPLGRFPPPSQRAPLDPRLDGIVLQALERDPPHRYQRVGELRAAVEAAAKGVPPGSSVDGEAPNADVANRGEGTTADWSGDPNPLGPLEVGRQVVLPAVGLIVAGMVTCFSWVGVAILLAFVAALDERYLLLCGYMTIPAIIQGLVIIRGGWRMIRLESHEWAVLGSAVALAPVSPGFLIGLPFGIWALRVLSKPEVSAGFRARSVEAKPRKQVPSGS
jgi:hypothetical protein